MNKQYMKYLLSSRKHLLLSLGMIEAIVIAALRVSSMMNISQSAYADSSFIDLTMVLMGCAGILAIVLPVMLLNFMHSRKESDQILALPVSRKEMLITTEVVVIGFIFLVYAVLELGVLLSLLPYLRALQTGPYLLHFVVMFVGIAVVSLFTSTIYLLGNTTVDGLIFLGGYYVIPFLVYFVAMAFDQAYVAGSSFVSNLLSGSLSFPWVFANLAVSLMDVTVYSGQSEGFLLFAISSVMHLAVSLFGLRKLFVERASESAGQLSDRRMGYPFLFAVYSIGTVLLATIGAHRSGDWQECLLLYAVIFVLYTVFSFIYRRVVRIRAKDFVLFGAAIAAAICFDGISYRTKGFGLAQNYDRNAVNLHYEFHGYDISAQTQELVPIEINEESDVQVSFRIDIREDNTEIQELLEDIRQRAIEDFYKKNSYYNQGTGWLTLSVFENYRWNERGVAEYDRSYFYDLSGYSLTSEDLLAINEYTDIYVYCMVNGIYEEFTLRELLDQK